MPAARNPVHYDRRTHPPVRAVERPDINESCANTLRPAHLLSCRYWGETLQVRWGADSAPKRDHHAAVLASWPAAVATMCPRTSAVCSGNYVINRTVLVLSHNLARFQERFAPYTVVPDCFGPKFAHGAPKEGTESEPEDSPAAVSSNRVVPERNPFWLTLPI